MSAGETSPVALLTGATGGLGVAIAGRLASDGYRLALTYRSSRAAAEELAASLDAEASVYELDAADRKRPKALVREIEEDLGPVAALVNNLGAQETRLLAMTSDELWDRMLEVNLNTSFRMCRAVLPGMARQRAGAIVNVGSLGALKGVPGESAYAAAKAALLAMTRSLAREMGKRGVRANVVVPGFVETAMTGDLSEEQIQGLRSAECLPAGTRPEHVAGAVSFLLSADAGAMTGQALIVDAGVSA
ncbi:MAG: SDR family oxidoreductase [Acidobacteriota bacterium]